MEHIVDELGLHHDGLAALAHYSDGVPERTQLFKALHSRIFARSNSRAKIFEFGLVGKHYKLQATDSVCLTPKVTRCVQEPLTLTEQRTDMCWII